jgi:RimJ/RimL family protein N-acetyltransferase
VKAVELMAGPAVITPYTAEHDVQTVTWLNTDELRDAFGITQQVTLSSHRSWLQAATNVVMWAIITPAHGHCGNTLLHCNSRHRSAYFQIYLGNPAVRRRGIGTSVVQAVLDHAFSTLNLHRVWLHTLDGSKSAERLYKGSGFVEEGLERESILRAGRFDSQRRWSILAIEWQAARRGRIQ